LTTGHVHPGVTSLATAGVANVLTCRRMTDVTSPAV